MKKKGMNVKTNVKAGIQIELRRIEQLQVVIRRGVKRDLLLCR